MRARVVSDMSERDIGDPQTGALSGEMSGNGGGGRGGEGPEALRPEAGEGDKVNAQEALASPEQLVRETADSKRAKEEITREDVMFDIEGVSVSYGDAPAVRDITFQVFDRNITALIGPSGCGKSTLIRCLNRTNDLIPSATVAGKVVFHGQDLYDRRVDPVEVRKRIGMVFQKPNPFPKSIYDNIAFGPKAIGMKGDMDELVERALTRAALWDEVKDRLKTNAYGMSGGQQQRLCIARALATDPDVLLMDEPCSALDPISTGRIEDLMLDLKDQVPIVIVTHNMQQAARVSDMTAFFTVELDADEKHRTGRMVEYDHTESVFTNPSDARTEAYVTGKVG
jgi:phosphate transport system ATP-binding protein